MFSDVVMISFVAAALVVLVIPGPGVLYVVARSASQGVGAGLVSAVGLSVGVFVHVAAAAGGLSALLLASSTAFGIVKLLGAAYLIYLGVTTLLAARRVPEIGIPSPLGMRRLFVDGVIVSVFNPKIAVFFLAFLPQFVDPGVGSAGQQILLLGLIYAALALITDGTYALLAGALRHLVQGRIMQGKWPSYITGSLYIGLGLNAALSGRKL